jgi:uncharacterized protein (TIGR02186 family)
MFRPRYAAAAASVAILITAGAVGAQGPARLRLDPPEVGMGMFFDGADVRLEGSVPAGQAAAVVCTGKEGPLELKKKGKVWGILWMNVGEIKLESVPSLYLLSTSRPLSELARRAVLDRLRLGYRALEAAAGSDAGGVFSEVIKLKESEGLFSFEASALRLTPTGRGSNRLSGSFSLPAHVPPGEYTVRLYGFERGQGQLLDEQKLHLVRTGLSLSITSLARDHGLLYGLFAVVVALAVGLLAGLVFGKGMKKAH